MKKYFPHILSAVLLASSAAMSCARAADLPLPVKAEPRPPAPFSWTGFYIGGFAGGAWTESVSSSDARLVAPVFVPGGMFPAGFPLQCQFVPGITTGCTANYNLHPSFIGGGTTGFNWQFGQALAGLEGEFGYIHLKGSGQVPFSGGVPCGGPANPCSDFFTTTEGNWYGTIEGRLGVTAAALNSAWSDHLLIYGKGGAAVVHVRTAEIFPTPVFVGFATTGTSNVWGWAAGAGVEWALNQNWSVKAEYEFLGIKTTLNTCGAIPPNAIGAGVPICFPTSLNGIQTAKFGVNYRF